ncbi:DUF1515 family protein [Rhizobium giardinii]|uniref:DUF1515 family protein n=1 Tax=Rhizobium giardinii TaxID=56731 RepID=UPI003D7010F1
MIEATVHQQLGALLAEVKNLREDFRRSEDKSDASRASMHRRMDELVDRTGKLEGAVAQVNDDVTEMKPVADDVRKWKLMGMGALAVVGLGATALGVSIAGFFDQLSKLFRGYG